MAEVNVFLNNRRVSRGVQSFESAPELVVIDRSVFDFDLVSHLPSVDRKARAGQRPPGDFLQYS